MFFSSSISALLHLLFNPLPPFQGINEVHTLNGAIEETWCKNVAFIYFIFSAENIRKSDRSFLLYVYVLFRIAMFFFHPPLFFLRVAQFQYGCIHNSPDVWCTTSIFLLGPIAALPITLYFIFWYKYIIYYHLLPPPVKYLI